MANAKAGGTFLCSGTCRHRASGHRSRRVEAHHPEGLHNGEQEEPQQQEVVDFQVEEPRQQEEQEEEEAKEEDEEEFTHEEKDEEDSNGESKESCESVELTPEDKELDTRVEELSTELEECRPHRPMGLDMVNINEGQQALITGEERRLRPAGTLTQRLGTMPWFRVLELLRMHSNDATKSLGLSMREGMDIIDTHVLVGFSTLLNDYPAENKFCPDGNFYNPELREDATKVGRELQNLLCDKGRWTADDMIRMQALIAFTKAVSKGQLLHGPLLAWAKWSHDSLVDWQDEAGLVYLMPVRHGVPFKQYPWRKHAEDAILCTKKWLMEIGQWPYYEQSVAQASLAQFDSTTTRLEENLYERNKAMCGAQRPSVIPAGTTIAVFRA